jgi:hypothetical protein
VGVISTQGGRTQEANVGCHSVDVLLRDAFGVIKLLVGLRDILNLTIEV